MSTNSPTVVVVEEQKRKHTGLLLIAGALATVLLGGSTFALWSANSSFSGGTITAGDLNLVSTADTAFYDVSSDRTDATATVPGTDGSQTGHLIDSIADWRMVPGDKVAAAFSSDITLSGDNLVGKLSITGWSDLVNNNPSTTWTYQIYQAGVLLVTETALPKDGTLLYLSAPGTGQSNGSEDANGTTVFPMTLTTEDFTVVVYGTFDSTAGDAGQVAANTDPNGVYIDQDTDATGTRQDANTTSVLAAMTLQLDQVRDTGAVFGTPGN